VILAPVAAFFSNNILALKIATSFLAIIMLITFYSILNRDAGRIAAFIGVLILATHPLTLVFSTQVLSEVLFAISFIVLLGMVDRWSKSEFKNNKMMIGISATLLVCILSREIGIVLLIVVMIFLVTKKQYAQMAMIFMAVIIVYSLWLFRNELIVAGREHPELRNMSLFSSHILTSNEQSIWTEFYMRIKVNGSYYSEQLGSLLYFSQYTISGEIDFGLYPIVDRTSSWITSAQKYVSFAYFFIIVVPLALTVYGMYAEYQKHRMFSFITVFLLLYTTLILVYPVYDIRFLYPLLLIIIYLFSSAIGEIVNFSMKRIDVAVSVMVLILIMPNIMWGVSFALEAHKYQTDQVAFYQDIKEHPKKMVEYTKPFGEVSKWFHGKHDSSAVILSRWKELSIFIPGKKVLLLDVFSSLNTFEQAIRDYGIKYIVTTKDDLGWHEYEYQMSMTKKYSFKNVHSVAGFDIFEIIPMMTSKDNNRQTNNVFEYLFFNLDNGRYDTLRTFFAKNTAAIAMHPPLHFYSGVTMECLGELDSAQNIFDQLYHLPQSMAMKQQIGFHQNVMKKRRDAELSKNRDEKAGLYLNIALNYWELDLRHIAFQFLDKSVQTDNNYLPAYSLFIYFALSNQDTINAEKAFEKMSVKFPDEIVIPIFRSIFDRMDSLKTVSSHKERSQIFVRLGGDYKMLGLSDCALESIRNAALLDPQNPLIALKLVDLYEKRSKYYPALQILNVTNSYRTDKRLEHKINEIKERY
jgi:tetratricopeptide (TPR) repeat protein